MLNIKRKATAVLSSQISNHIIYYHTKTNSVKRLTQLQICSVCMAVDQ